MSLAVVNHRNAGYGNVGQGRFGNRRLKCLIGGKGVVRRAAAGNRIGYGNLALARIRFRKDTGCGHGDIVALGNACDLAQYNLGFGRAVVDFIFDSGSGDGQLPGTDRKNGGSGPVVVIRAADFRINGVFSRVGIFRRFGQVVDEPVRGIENGIGRFGTGKGERVGGAVVCDADPVESEGVFGKRCVCNQRADRLVGGGNVVRRLFSRNCVGRSHIPNPDIRRGIFPGNGDRNIVTLGNADDLVKNHFGGRRAVENPVDDGCTGNGKLSGINLQ